MSLFKKIGAILPWIIVALWMVLIFYLSAQPAVHSNKLSKGVTEVVVETVKRVTPHSDVSLERFNHIVRKNAHFFIYLMLAMWVFHALIKSKISGLKGWLLALGICILYAITDEIHQIFVPGRGPQAKDVFIDSAGVVVGLSLYQASSMVLKKLKRKRLYPKIFRIRTEK
ncbi:VanZ family protein [Neobacillus sp. 19]|uniref:VanZ family protein n=1 Tax=Neobacillus sp. 19 TaxID=3394458 RepID=UPI003BF724ED